jgi:molecular chaperone GrpE
MAEKKNKEDDVLDALRGSGLGLTSLDGELDAVNEKDNEIAKLTEENRQLKDKFLRTVAELENARRILADEKDKAVKYAISGFASALVPVIENYFLAFENANEEEIERTFFEGVTLTFNELKKVFEKFGLKRIYPEGEKFNPEAHQAIAQINSEKEENTISEVSQAGYMLNDRVLKPALVVVSNGKK